MSTIQDKFNGLSRLICQVASLIILAQIGFILIQGEPLCLNTGCTLVENQTKIPPLYFNVAGLLLFQLVYWLYKARHGHAFTRAALQITLIAAMAAEGVLLAFQYIVTQAFCSYCLAIFACIVLLTLLSGLRSLLLGLCVCCAATMAFFSLEVGGKATLPFQEGAAAIYTGDKAKQPLHFFFSSTCPHCEKVMELLSETSAFTIYFHPVDQVDAHHLPFPHLDIAEKASPAANRNFLFSLGINEIPVVFIPGDMERRIVIGEELITEYVLSCEQSVQPVSPPAPPLQSGEGSVDYSSPSSSMGTSTDNQILIPGLSLPQEEGCALGQPDC